MADPPAEPATLDQRPHRPGSGTGLAGSRHRRLALVMFVTTVLIQLCAVYWPSVDVQGPVSWTDKAGHALLFLVPTVTGLLAGLRPAYLVAALALHAPLSELLQHLVLPHRSGDIWDAVADLAGVVLGVTSAVVTRTLRR